MKKQHSNNFDNYCNLMYQIRFLNAVEGGERVIEVITAIAIWCVALICIEIMRRIQPENKVYRILVVFNALMVAIILIYSAVI